MKLSLKRILKEVLSDEEIEARAIELADPKGELRWEMQRLQNERKRGWGDFGVPFSPKEMLEKEKEFKELERHFFQRKDYFMTALESERLSSYSIEK